MTNAWLNVFIEDEDLIECVVLRSEFTFKNTVKSIDFVILRGWKTQTISL